MSVKVGDQVTVTSTRGNHFKVGQIVTVRHVYEDGMIDVVNLDGTRSQWLCRYQYELYQDKMLDIIANLSAEVARLSKRVESLEKRSYSTVNNVTITSELSAKQLADLLTDKLSKMGINLRNDPKTLTREQLIEKAKQDVEELSDKYFDGINFEVKFVVNRDKRTVVALNYYDNAVYKRGIAKCAPDDCFNVHFGKAIALRRALGLDIPKEYVNAPQPTVAKVGDKIRLKGYPLVYKVTPEPFYSKESVCVKYLYMHEITAFVDDSSNE